MYHGFSLMVRSLVVLNVLFDDWVWVWRTPPLARYKPGMTPAPRDAAKDIWLQLWMYGWKKTKQ